MIFPHFFLYLSIFSIIFLNLDITLLIHPISYQKIIVIANIKHHFQLFRSPVRGYYIRTFADILSHRFRVFFPIFLRFHIIINALNHMVIHLNISQCVLIKAIIFGCKNPRYKNFSKYTHLFSLIFSLRIIMTNKSDFKQKCYFHSDYLTPFSALFEH